MKRYWPHVGADRIAARRWSAFVKIAQDTLGLSATQAEVATFAKNLAESIGLNASQTEFAAFREAIAEGFTLTNLLTATVGLLNPMPANRVIDWTAAGVAGGVPERTTLSTIAVAIGNDTDQTATVQAALNAATSGTVVLLGPGIVQISSLNIPSNVTLRGRLDYFPTSSSATIGSGPRTFVDKPAGLDMPNGAVIWIRRHSKPGHWMKATVTGQTANSVTVNVTSFNGSGTYNDWIVGVSIIVPIGGSGSTSCINMGTTGVSLGASVSSSTKVLTAGATRDSVLVTHDGTGPAVNTTKYAVITSLNDSEVALYGATNTVNAPGATWTDGWSSIPGYTAGSRARGQIVKITSVSGNQFGFYPPLFRNYTDSPWATIFDSSVERAGVENFMFVSQPAGSNQIAHVSMFRAAESWVKGCTFDFTENDHIRMEFCYRCEVRSNFTEDKFQTADSNSNYLGMITPVRKSTLIRIEDNIVKRAKDGIMLNWGAAGCVVSYNYCLNGYNASVPTFLVKGVTMNHGAHPQYNLLDGNIITHKASADSTWGTSSDGLIHRCAIFGYDERSGPDNLRDFAATLFFLTQVNYAVDIWEGNIRYAAINCQIGHPTNWPARAPLRKPPFPTGWGYENPPIAIALGKGGDDLSNPILLDPAPSFLDHLNYDYASNVRYFDPTNAATSSPDSYCYSSKPTWWNDAAPWPPVDGGIPRGLSVTNPARIRHDTRASQGKIYTHVRKNDVQLFMHFETGTDGQLITPTLLNSSMQGTNSTGWETITDIFSMNPGATNVTTSSAAAHPLDKVITVNGAAASFTGGLRGLRCTGGTDGFLQRTGITQAPTGAALACHFRWNGPGINSSPRDLIALRPDYTGGYQVMQGRDGPSRDLHAHWRTYSSGTGVDTTTPALISLNHWYWIRMKAVVAGNTFRIEVYDAENGYTLVGVTQGAVDTQLAAVGTTTIWLGLIQYSAGASESFYFSNVEVNFNGTLPVIPGAV